MANYGRQIVEQVLDELGVVITAENAGWGRSLCPLHDDDNPSFSVNMEEGAWVCRAGCGSNGDLAVLVSLRNEEPVRDVRRRLHKKLINASSDDVERYLSNSDQVEDPLLKTVSEDPALVYVHGVAPQYMLKRGFTPETLKEWDVGWDANEQAVVIPITKDGQRIGVVKRRINPGTKPKYDYKPNGLRKSEVLFGLEHVPDDAEVVTLVEGPLDAMWLWQCGFDAVAYLGAEVSDWQGKQLLRRFSELVLAPDHDLAGEKGFMKAVTKLSRARLRWLMFPIDKKDVQTCSVDELSTAYSVLREIFI